MGCLTAAHENPIAVHCRKNPCKGSVELSGLSSAAAGCVAESQCGFCRICGTIDKIFAACQL